MSAFETRIQIKTSVQFLLVNFGALFLLSGCMTPQNTVFPHFSTMHPEYEKAKLRQSSPFPSSHSGPDVFGASREINQPRAFARDAAETFERVLFHQGNNSLNPNPVLNPPTMGYPQVVPNGY